VPRPRRPIGPAGPRCGASLGGLHHIAISVEHDQWQQLVGRLQDAGVEHVVHSDVSAYFTDPDGAQIELIADPLGEMYGSQVL
jgi:catechol 2,3-dioxygenase-like lactoylglutathione lyase family enzyme